jgi:hypothetical protein
MLWLPDGCVVGGLFWTLEHARAVDAWTAALRGAPAAPALPAPDVPA